MGATFQTQPQPAGHAFSIPGTESSQALDVISDKMGGGGNTASAKVVFTVPVGTKLTDAGPKAAVEKAVAALKGAPQVAAVADPYEARTVSPDARTAYATVTYAVSAPDLTEQAKEALITTGETAGAGGVEAEFGGDATQAGSEAGATEGIGVIVAAVVLLVTFGALVAAGLPLLTAMIGVGVGMAGIQIATGFFDLSSSTSALATMLGLAVGIDYALFIVSRYRHELTEGRDGEEAAARAVGTAGSAVVFAGLTVIIALAALAVVGIPFLAAMGFAAAGTVAVAVLINLSLLPALLGFAGRKILPKTQRHAPGKHERVAQTPFGERWARWVLKYRVLALIVAVAAIGVVAIPATDLHLALPDDSTAAEDSTQRKAYDQLSAGFGAGFILADDSIIKSLGFALAFGVAVDAFIVRMTIVPAVLSLVGRAAWWLPRWLGKLLPNVDVEGEQLTKNLGTGPAEDRELQHV
ncbi:MMPL family transporter [Actinoplanes sp. TFC3]|uniref:MMPL family transporter n=1 Tax=Actinoplanes sp. TFC3 TaxID=1710355 RepID=UPI00082CD7E1|nr:MMPL family transporter [Actinoplanes sp. TFC3]